MPNMSKNRHRWKESLGDQTVGALEEAAKQLTLSWEADTKSPEDYPLNTEITFGETKARLRGEPQVQGPIKLPPPTPPPRSLSELLKEETIKAVYEDQNNGTYEDALKMAGAEDEKAHLTFRKLLRAIEAAYEIRAYGWEAIPKPRVHFLHRNLLEIAALVHLNDLTHQGLVEFLDDICPCGEKHNAEAIRKLRKRHASASRARS